ncbi:MAG TPA: hypothetical protein ENI11_02215 [Actinobacteria bacterium]|nr:hypothetical protein [Actinomycetota bacterium]
MRRQIRLRFHVLRFFGVNFVMIIALGVLISSSQVEASPITANSTQPEQLTDKLEPPAECATCHNEPYRDWSGTMMGNDFRDPSWLAALSIAEQDVPGIGDYCLRCHGAGWFEGKSEPPDGDSRGKSFAPPPKIDRESIPLCDFCHRVERVGERKSAYDDQMIAEGNGAIFIRPDDPWKGASHPLKEIHKKGEFCGSCHDVSNPLVKNADVPAMDHPLERTYTEWKYSFFGENEITCQKCHPPMKFPGAQTWILYPGMASLYPDVDEGWVEAGFNVKADRSSAWKAARERNVAFMKRAADIKVEAEKTMEPGEETVIKVTVVNKSGHRLPTGFAEGRHMWIHLRVTDSEGMLVFEDGKLDDDGKIIETEQSKVYEQKAGVDGEKSFHFALVNSIIKDNRIPPFGFRKTAYEAEGAFIVGADYQPGQNWDITKYEFDIPGDALGPFTVQANLKYETYSAEYMNWLVDTDKTLAANYGGEAPATPDGARTWGETTYRLWETEAKGRPLLMATAVASISYTSATSMPQLMIEIIVGVFILTLIVLSLKGKGRTPQSKESLSSFDDH